MKNNEILFSLILPSFNSKNTIIDTLESLLAQKFTNYEIIIVDDGSTDQYSIKIVEKYSEKYGKIHLFKMDTNKGAPYCMNFGIKKANGKWMGIIDSDAIYPPEWLKLLETKITNDYEVIGGPYKHPSENKGYFKKVYYYIEESGFPRTKEIFDKKNNYKEPCLGGGNFFFTKQVFETVGGFDSRYRTSYDRLFQCKALESNFAVKYFPELYVNHPLYNYKNIFDIFRRGYFFNKWRVKLIKEINPPLLSDNYTKLDKILPALAILSILSIFICVYYLGYIYTILILLLLILCLYFVLAYKIKKQNKMPVFYIPGILFVETIKKIIGIYVYIFKINPSYSYWKK